MRTYIAGPMRGVKDFNWPAFDACEERLAAMGHKVVNPARLDREAGLKPDAPVSIEFLRRTFAKDICHIAECDAIAMLPGWQRSECAPIEYATAKAFRLVILDHNGDFYHESILDEAKRLTTGDRHETYGHPLDDYSTTAAMWSAYLGHHVTAEQAMACMMLVKISRLSRNPFHRDSLVDVAGYANCYQMSIDERARRASLTPERR